MTFSYIQRNKRTHQNYSHGMLLYRRRQYKEAIPFLWEEYKEKQDVRIYFCIGKCYFEIRNYDKAKIIFDEIISRDKTDIYAHMELGRMYKRQGKLAEAEKEFKKYIEIDKDRTPHGHLELGKLYKEQGKLAEAEKEFKKVIEIDAKSPHGYLELGILYKEQGKLTEAEKEFKKVIEIDAKSPYGYLKLGILYSEQRDDIKAQEMYNRLLKEIGESRFDLRNRYIHLKKHFSDDLSKEIHTVFKVDYLPLFKKMQELMSNGKYQLYRGYGADIFIVKMENCGYSGGKNGDKHILNYVTIIMFPYSDNIITLYPSDGTEEIGNQIESTVYTKDNIRLTMENPNLSVVESVQRCFNKLIFMEERRQV